MSRFSLKFAEAAKAGLVIQQCGRYHIFRPLKNQGHYSDSLAAQFNAAGVHVLPVFITCSPEDLSDFHLVAREKHPNSFVLEGLSSQGFYKFYKPGEIMHLAEMLNAYSGENPLPIVKDLSLDFAIKHLDAIVRAVNNYDWNSDQVFAHLEHLIH